jgi:OOP family OmpA-OmpF porin
MNFCPPEGNSMKKQLIAAVGTALIASAMSPVFAADVGPYVGVDVGGSSTSNDHIHLTKSSDTVFGGTLGYQINRNLAAEAFYTQLGDYAGTNDARTARGDGKAHAAGVVAVGILPLTNEFSLYGKLGVANTKTDNTGHDALGSVDLGATRTAATYGAGARYDFTPAFGLRFGVDHYGEAQHGFDFAPLAGNVRTGTRDFSTDVYSLTALYKF